MSIPTLRPPAWRNELARFAATLPPKCLMVEVGSFAGESSEIFLASVGLLACVDTWDASGDTFPPARHMVEAEREFDRRMNGRALKLKLLSVEAAHLFCSIDAVYIDGDHRYESVAADLRAWRPKVRAGGIVSGHDWFIPGVRRAVLESFDREPDAIYGDGDNGQGTWAYGV